jgi:hypothetical protein
MGNNGMKTLSRYFSKLLFGSKLFWGLVIFIILAIYAVFIVVSPTEKAKGDMIEALNASYIYGLFPCILLICSCFSASLFKKKVIELCISSGFPRKKIWSALNFVCIIASEILLVVYCAVHVLIYSSFITYLVFFRIILACLIIYTNGSFCMFITSITKSPILSLVISFLSVNLMSLISLLSVNIIHNGYLANYFTTLALSNVLVASDYSENYAVTFLLYLFFGITFTVMGLKFFEKSEIK